MALVMGCYAFLPEQKYDILGYSTASLIFCELIIANDRTRGTSGQGPLINLKLPQLRFLFEPTVSHAAAEFNLTYFLSLLHF